MTTYTPTPIVESSKTERQNKQYHLLTELQKMAREIPLKYQQRIPCTLLSSLANSLIDETVFEIVLHLKEIQQMTERKLMEQRANMCKTHKCNKLDLQRRHQEELSACMARPHNLPLVNKRIEEETKALEKIGESVERMVQRILTKNDSYALETKFGEDVQKMDQRILTEIDNCVNDQQNTLEKAGVPGFFPTMDPLEVKLQMYLLQFIHQMRDRRPTG